jgi:hypothetical protein
MPEIYSMSDNTKGSGATACHALSPAASRGLCAPLGGSKHAARSYAACACGAGAAWGS